MNGLSIEDHLARYFEASRLELASRVPPLSEAELDEICATVGAALARERTWLVNPVEWWQALIAEAPRQLWEHFLAGKDLLSGAARVRVIAGTQPPISQRRIVALLLSGTAMMPTDVTLDVPANPEAIEHALRIKIFLDPKRLPGVARFRVALVPLIPPPTNAEGKRGRPFPVVPALEHLRPADPCWLTFAWRDVPAWRAVVSALDNWRSKEKPLSELPFRVLLYPE